MQTKPVMHPDIWSLLTPAIFVILLSPGGVSCLQEMNRIVLVQNDSLRFLTYEVVNN